MISTTIVGTSPVYGRRARDQPVRCAARVERHVSGSLCSHVSHVPFGVDSLIGPSVAFVLGGVGR